MRALLCAARHHALGCALKSPKNRDFSLSEAADRFMKLPIF